MLTRAWLLVSGVWALLCLWGGANRADGSGIEQKDLVLALAPFVLGWLLALAVRFVITGSVMKRPRAVPYRRP
jgi:hypothetical protein